MIPESITKLVGQKLAGPVFFGGLGLLILLALLGLSRCGGGDQAARQAEQTTRSSEAVAGAAADAMARYGARVANEAAQTRDAEVLNQEIANAKTRAAQRRALLERLCQDPARHLDPACLLRAGDPAGVESGR